LKYWRREPYLGFGADAQSFDGESRWRKEESAAAYVENPAAIDHTVADEVGEKFYLGLRLSQGIDADWSAFREPVEQFLRDGLLEWDGRRLRLTSRGVLLSNEVFAEFVPVGQPVSPAVSS
jgi:oxygen-independent coproporphyrinogen-3 oxidase